MKFAACCAAGALIGAMTAAPGVAQTAAPLSYIQPLPPQSVQAVQDRLRQAGAYTGAVDGVWGPDSEAALERFQQSHQLTVTGQLNQATAATLGIDAASLAAVASPPVAPAVAPAVMPLVPPPQPAAQTLSVAGVRAVQSRLKALNFYPGAVDGVWGASTQDAIERFQQGRGLQANGQLNPATVAAMGLAPDALSFR